MILYPAIDLKEGACVRLLRDTALCDRLGQAARARMRETYDAARISDAIAGLIRPFLRG